MTKAPDYLDFLETMNSVSKQPPPPAMQRADNNPPVAAKAMQAAHAERHFRTDHLFENLGTRAFSGGVITAVSQASRFGLFMALTVVLARMLNPQDFGLVAMALALTSILHMFREAGLSTATVQQQTITHAQVSNLFWVNVFVGLCCAGVGMAAAPAMALFYRDDRLIPITIWLSLTLLAGGAAVQHLALLNRQMRFKAIALIDVGAMLASLVAGIGMAALGFGYWSLVGAQLASSFAELAMAWMASGWRPQLPQRGTGTRSMLNFGASLTFAMLLRRITSNADTFLLGRYFGAHALGLYSRGLALVMRPLDQFLVPFDKVFLPVLSRLQDQPERYRRNFLQVYNAMALVSFPIAGILLGLAAPIVVILLGPDWKGVTPILASFALVALYYPIAGASMWLLTTQRRNRDILRSGVAISLISLVSCVAGLPFGPVGVALSFSLFGLLVRLPIQYYIVGRSGPVNAADQWKVFFKHLPFWAIVAVGAYLPQMLAPNGNPVLHLVLGLAGASLFAAILAWIIPSYRREMLELTELLKRVLPKRSTKSGPKIDSASSTKDSSHRPPASKRILFQRKTVWWPTGLGWCCLLVPPGFLLASWVFLGETFLASTNRVEADTLVVEGWIGRESLPFVKEEFERGDYKQLVVTGGLTGHSWSQDRWSVTEIARKELVRLGFPTNKLVLAPCPDVENQRTYESAVAAKRLMDTQSLHPKAINVISRGPHVRRTYLVYRKVFGPSVKIGAISWNPYAGHGNAWWRNSVRSKELLDETFGFAYEALLGSGRRDGTLAIRWVLLASFGLVSFLAIRSLIKRNLAADRPRLPDLSVGKE